MNSRPNNKSGSTNAFDFDLGLGSGRSTPMNNQRSQTSTPYTYSAAQQRPNTTSSWTHQPSVQSGLPGSLTGPTSMVGDIFGKTWNSPAPPSASVSTVGIVNNKNPNLFGDLVSSAMGQNKGSNNAPLKSGGQNAFGMGSMANSLPKTSSPANASSSFGSNSTKSSGNVNVGGNYNRSHSAGANSVNLGGINNRNPNLGAPSMKSGVGGIGMGSSKDPFGSLVDFASKPSGGMNSASKKSDSSGLGDDSFGDFQNAPAKTSGSSFPSGAFPTNNDPLGDFGFPGTAPSNQSQQFTGANQFQNAPAKTSESSFPNSDPLGDFGFPSGAPSNQTQQSSGANDFDALFSSTGGTSQMFPEGDDWGVNTDFGDDGATTTELDGLPPPPAGVSAPAAKSKGMDNYKQGQFPDAIKWLSWAIILLEKAGDDDGAMEVLTSRASCYKEVGEYKKAVADCTKVLDRDGKNVSVLVQRALLYESMEKYKLGAEDLRTVLKFDPSNRLAISTIHRLQKMAG